MWRAASDLDAVIDAPRLEQMSDVGINDSYPL